MVSPSPRAMELAIAHGDTKEVELLLDAEPGLISAELSEHGRFTPLMWACRHRHATIVELLLERGAEVNALNGVDATGEGGNSPLWFAAQGVAPGGVPVARLLLARGADINLRGQEGMTPFYMAVVWVHMEMVQFLLERGANPAFADDIGKTPLQAVREAHDWALKQEKRSPEVQALLYRAPRMIAFLEKLESGRK